MEELNKFPFSFLQILFVYSSSFVAARLPHVLTKACMPNACKKHCQKKHNCMLFNLNTNVKSMLIYAAKQGYKLLIACFSWVMRLLVFFFLLLLSFLCGAWRG